MIKNVIFCYTFILFNSTIFGQTSTNKPQTESASKQAPQATPLVSQMRASTSRQQGKIDSIFPFDIALRTTDSTLTNSQNVLPRNGKPTLLAFWLTTCYPCMMELDTYIKEYTTWQKESPFNLITISTDFPERFRKIGKVVEEKKFPFPAYWDFNREFKEVLPGGLNGLPQIFLFDKDGKLVWQHKRYFTGDEKQLFAKVKELNEK